jgi:hypothetical protein
MPLTMRQTGLGSGIDKDRPDYTVYCGEWAIGRIYETRGGPVKLRWFWSFTAVSGPMTRSDRVATLEEAKAQFQKSWTSGRRGRSWRRCPHLIEPRFLRGFFQVNFNLIIDNPKFR